eukprot:6862889-Prymnesium_polylepis.1
MHCGFLHAQGLRRHAPSHVVNTPRTPDSLTSRQATHDAPRGKLVGDGTREGGIKKVDIAYYHTHSKLPKVIAQLRFEEND